jgi:hypothetical protein
MRTKFLTPNSDALRLSCLETPINLPTNSTTDETFLTDEEKSLYLESPSRSGVGMFKGKSLCFSENDVHTIHKRFHSLYLNRMRKEQEIKTTTGKHHDHHFYKDVTFSP